MDKNIKQTAFDFKPSPAYLKEDFMASECNVRALNAIELFPNWPFFALSIYGPKGCGKTHLAHIFKQKVLSNIGKPTAFEMIDAKEVKMRKVPYLHKNFNYLVVENMRSGMDEEAFFHLFNLYQNEGGYLLLTSEIPLSRLPLKLADLKSRLKMVPSVAILEPSEDMLEALIVKLFTDRQIVVSLDVLNYILQNMERSFSYALKLVECIDEISLSLKRAVTIPIVKKAMQQIAHHEQQELF